MALDLTAIVKAAIETSRPILDNLRHEVKTDFEPEPMCVGGDPVRLTQVFANLLNNAAKYTNHGGHITVTTRRENGEAVVSVKDDGIGIAPLAGRARHRPDAGAQPGDFVAVHAGRPGAFAPTPRTVTSRSSR